MEVISADRPHDYKVGATETTQIATVLMSNIKTGTCILSEEACDCKMLKELLRTRRV